MTIRGTVPVGLRYDVRLGRATGGNPMKRSVFIAALAFCSGCSVLIQNRYSFLGIEVGEIDTPAEAELWSLALLLGVAVISAVLAVLAFWLAQRWLPRRRTRAKERLLAASSPPPARAAEPEPVNAAAEPTPEGVLTAK
jgi:hypothetical protein